MTNRPAILELIRRTLNYCQRNVGIKISEEKENILRSEGVAMPLTKKTNYIRVPG